jgi:hypothetical protein
MLTPTSADLGGRGVLISAVVCVKTALRTSLSVMGCGQRCCGADGRRLLHTLLTMFGEVAADAGRAPQARCSDSVPRIGVLNRRSQRSSESTIAANHRSLARCNESVQRIGVLIESAIAVNRRSQRINRCIDQPIAAANQRSQRVSRRSCLLRAGHGAPSGGRVRGTCAGTCAGDV